MYVLHFSPLLSVSQHYRNLTFSLLWSINQNLHEFLSIFLSTVETGQMRTVEIIKCYNIEKTNRGHRTVNNMVYCYTKYNLGNWNSEIKNYWGIKRNFHTSSVTNHCNITHFHYTVIKVQANQLKFAIKNKDFFPWQK